MHPFSSDMNCLYKITHFESGSGVKFEPRHPSWWVMLSLAVAMTLMLGGMFLSEAIFGVKGGNGAVLIAAPGFLLFIFILVRINSIMHTYGSQNFGAITISQGELLIEVLDDEVRGLLSWLAPLHALFGGNPFRRKVVDQVNLPLEQIRAYDWDVRTINDVRYVSLEGFVETVDSDEEPVVMGFPITPFFRTQESTMQFVEHMYPYLHAWDGLKLDIDTIEQTDESDPSYV